jgi:PAS domain S-box-containing protein
MADNGPESASDLLDSATSEHHTPARIYPLVSDPGNEKLLVDWLDSIDKYEAVEGSPAIEDASFDLCIVDETALTEHFEALERRKQSEHPVLLPYLFLREDEGPDFLQNGPGHLPDTLIQEAIDELLSLPVRQFELRWRIESLLRMRGQTRELANREGELRHFRRAVNAAGHPIHIADTDGQIRFVNPAFERLTGYSEADAIGETPHLLNSGAMPDSYFEDLWATIQDGDVWTEEITNEKKNGDRYYAQETIAPIHDAAGDVTGYVAIQTDITEEKERTRLLQTLIDNLPGIVYRGYNEPGWPMDFVAGQVAELTGYEESKLETGDVSWGYDIVHPADRDHVTETVDAAVEAGEAFEITYRIRTATGETRWVWEQGQEVDPFTREEMMLEGFITDITERKERELELHQKTRAIDEAPIGIVLTDPAQADNPLIYVNDAFTDLTGYSKSDAVGRNCRFLQGDNTDPETVARIRAGIDAEEPVSVTIRNYRKDGSGFWNRLELAPVRNTDGEIINYVGFQQDVTELRERQRHLQTIDRVLRHNLNNDLNVVQGMAELIQEEGSDPLTDYAQRIIDTGNALLRTMDKERKITALLVDQPVSEAVDLTATIQSVVDLVREDYPSATVELSVPDQAVVRATSEIRTAIEELLRNALEHNDSETPHVHVAVSETATGVAVRVCDNGPGIPEMERDILLGRDVEMTQLYHGKGLGLWLVHLIVRRCNGTLEFAANEPSGSVVTVQLQAADTV